MSKRALGPSQPPIQWVLMAVSPGVKWPGCEADHSPPPSAKIKNDELHYISSICLHDVVLNKLSTGVNCTFHLGTVDSSFEQKEA
jgi:hypothetical protein